MQHSTFHSHSLFIIIIKFHSSTTTLNEHYLSVNKWNSEIVLSIECRCWRDEMVQCFFLFVVLITWLYHWLQLIVSVMIKESHCIVIIIYFRFKFVMWLHCEWLAIMHWTSIKLKISLHSLNIKYEWEERKKNDKY